MFRKYHILLMKISYILERYLEDIFLPNGHEVYKILNDYLL